MKDTLIFTRREVQARLGLAVGWLAIVVSLSSGAVAFARAAPPGDASARTVVFVCTHGNVKSLIAREWFNRLAQKRGLGVRALSRGVTPEASVPPAIAKALHDDGFDVTGFEPRALSAADASQALRVVGIGVELASAVERGDAPFEAWEGIPPASERYAASRDALRARIEALLDTLERSERRP